MLVLFAAAGTARAHQSTVTWSKVVIAPNGEVHYNLRISTRDLYEALGLDKDRDASDPEIREAKDRLFDYVLARVHVLGDGKPCPVTARDLSILTQTERFAELRFTAACPLPLAAVALDYQLFFDLDPRHLGLLQASYGDKTLNQEFSRGLGRFEWRLGLAAPASLGPLDYIVEGMEHIYTGYDHIAFLVALLLVAVVRRTLRQATPEVLKIVTAFTLAHSLTLILAALEVISLPSRFVESAIAASIVYVAVENLLVTEPRHRWPLALLFGLVHGLGFASMLRPLLPAGDVIVPLLLFNVGVELGQLSIVLILLPVLALASTRAPDRYRRLVALGGSAVIGLLGLVWLVERVAGIELVSQVLG
jgi:hydrogenase/urease accessory protein HupE